MVKYSHEIEPYIDSGLKNDTSCNILVKAQDHAGDNLRPLAVYGHIAKSSLINAGIAAMLTFAIKGSINFHRVSKGQMRSDDAVDDTLGGSFKAAITCGITASIIKSMTAILGIPIAIAVPLGITFGIAISIAVKRSLDALYNHRMGGRCIQLSRRHTNTLSVLFDNMERHFDAAEAQQIVLENKVKNVPKVNFQPIFRKKLYKII